MRRLILAALAALLALPAAAAAQGGVARPGVTVRVTPRAGVLTPADWFYAEYAHLGVDPVEWTEGALLRAPLVGLTAEVEIGGSGLWIRGEVLRTVDGETYLAHAILHEVSGFDPPWVERTRYWIPSAVTMGTLDLAFPTRFALPWGIQPYFTAGVGGKRYSFQKDPLSDAPRTVVAPEEGVVWMANLGGGVMVDVLGVELDLAVRDAVSEYWDQLQHDVVWLAGVRWQIF